MECLGIAERPAEDVGASVGPPRGRPSGPIHAEVSSSVDPAAWDALCASAPGPTVFQASCWGAFLAESLGHEPFYLSARDAEGRPAAILQGFLAPPWHQGLFERPGSRVLLPILRRLAPVASWRFGPLFLADPAVVAPACARALDEFLRRRRVMAVADAVTAVPSLCGPLPDPMDGWLPPTGSSATLLVDLTAPEEALWRRLKASARKAIRAAERDGVTVRRLETVEELRAYDAFFRAHNVERPGRWFSFRNLAAMWRHLRPAGAVELFAAERDGELMAGLGIWRFGGYLVEFSARQSRACREGRVYAPDLIKWQSMRWGHATGARIYDLAGVAPNPATAKERGIRQFKEKWGGAYAEYALRGRVLGPVRHGLFTAGAGLYRRLRGAR